MNNLSYWEQDINTERSDIAIIGGGFVGSFTGLFIAQQRPDLKVTVYDRDLHIGGASTRNAGFACFGSISEILSTKAQYNEEQVMRVIKDRYTGLQLFIKTLGQENIDYNPCGGYEVFRASDKDQYLKCLDYLPNLNRHCHELLGLQEVFRDKSSITDNLGVSNFNNVIFNPYEGSLHPAKALKRLHDLGRQAGVQFIGQSDISNIETSKNDVLFNINKSSKGRSDKLIIATNGFTADLMPIISDIQPARNMVLVTHPIPDLNINGTFHFDSGYIYFRNIGNRILLGGARNIDPKTENTSTIGFNKRIKIHLENFLHNHLISGYDSSIIDTWWSGIMGIGNALEPKIAWENEHILTGIRLNGMGVALSSLVGQKLSNKVLACY